MKEEKITLELTRSEAKDLITGYGYFFDDVQHEYSSDEKEKCSALLGHLNCKFCNKFGEWAW